MNQKFKVGRIIIWSAHALSWMCDSERECSYGWNTILVYLLFSILYTNLRMWIFSIRRWIDNIKIKFKIQSHHFLVPNSYIFK